MDRVFRVGPVRPVGPWDDGSGRAGAHGPGRPTLIPLQHRDVSTFLGSFFIYEYKHDEDLKKLQMSCRLLISTQITHFPFNTVFANLNVEQLRV